MKATLSSLIIFFTLVKVAAAAAADRPLIVPPLKTSDYRIVDSKAHPVRLASVNWYGFDEGEYVAGGLDHASLDEIVSQIQAMGFNSVRLPWANETLERDPMVKDYAVAANPEFKGKHAMQVMDAVVASLARAHIFVVLDNHISRADWCCNETDGNGLWASMQYPEVRWIADWQAIVRRYKKQPYVVGADLRNELRSGAAWGGTTPALDWHAAAERAGSAVLKENSKLLIIVEGPEYSTDFRGAAALPVRLKVANRLVYSPHDYGMSQPEMHSYEDLKAHLDRRWGYLLHAQPAVPLWVGEFGVCQDLASCKGNGFSYEPWFKWFVQYLKENDLGWAYWPLNGTQSTGQGRKYGALESYGLLSTDYKTVAAPDVMKLLGPITASTAKHD